MVEKQSSSTVHPMGGFGPLLGPGMFAYQFVTPF
jgi:hypothetical protein